MGLRDGKKLIDETGSANSGIEQTFGPVLTQGPFPNEYWSLLYNSPQMMRDLTERSEITIRTSYTPTDWSKECSDKEFWDGLREQDGTCPVCFMRRTRTGACSTDCVGDPSHPKYEG